MILLKFGLNLLPCRIFSLLIDIMKQLHSKTEVNLSGIPLVILPPVYSGFIKKNLLLVFNHTYFSQVIDRNKSFLRG